MRSRTLWVLRVVKLLFGFAAIIYTASGCDPDRSVNPFYRPQDVVFDAGLLGNWRGTDSFDGMLVVKALTGDSYTVELTQVDKGQKKETCWTFEAHLFNYNQKPYLDLLPTAFKISGKREKFQAQANDLEFLIPVHTAMRLDHDAENLSLSWSGTGEMSSFFKKEDEETSKKKRLAEEKRQRTILAMSTEQLQQEVLGGTPEGDAVVEMGMHFVRMK